MSLPDEAFPPFQINKNTSDTCSFDSHCLLYGLHHPLRTKAQTIKVGLSFRTLSLKKCRHKLATALPGLLQMFLLSVAFDISFPQPTHKVAIDNTVILAIT